jgi:polyribonucleotide nucleotidyltransferase
MEDLKLALGAEELIIGTGKLAKQADGAVTVKYGGTMVLVTCVCSHQAREGIDFFPLTVEYQERTFAAGKIPGGFFKREGRPSQKAILTSRMIDRPIRPLFPEGMMNEVQIIATVLSCDGKNDSDILGIIGASAALTISDIPFNGPIGAVRVGMVDDKFILNPTIADLESTKLDLVVVGNAESVVMLEGGANMVGEDKILEAISFGHEGLKPLLDLQKKLRDKAGKPKRQDVAYVPLNKELYAKIVKNYRDKIKEALQISEKQARIEKLGALKEEMVKAEGAEEDEVRKAEMNLALAHVEEEVVRDIILKEKKRLDGRKFDEIRALSSEINILPCTHGSALFTRGETQALAVTTLGTGADEQRIDALEGESFKSFMLHYNFPPFSVGEAKPLRGPGRREIGHGALAEKALGPVLPSKDTFPYTIRVVSEILESNGSSSMASVCAGSLSLMASGVPITDAVSGIAMGLVKGDGGYAVLTDIAGAEDHFGDMDLKIAGTKNGVTAIQMDLKVKGIGHDILKTAFEQAKKGRLEIMENMRATIAEPLKEVAPNAPRIVTLNIKLEKIREVIGTGGKVIRGIIAATGAEINIEDDGTCQVASADKESLEKAVKMIEDIISDPEVGRVYDSTVVKIMDFGAFVEFMPGREGLVHVSEISNEYIKNVSEAIKEGQKVKVKLVGFDDHGRVRLSIKQAQVEENKG